MLLVGEVNPLGARPRFALYHLPRGRAGDRLRAILGLSDVDYDSLLDKVNLCTGAWSLPAARQRAAEIRAEVAWAGWKLLVLLGARVRQAFGGPAPFEHGRDPLGCTWLGLPHPSGRCLLWNDRANVARARAILMELVPAGIPWGKG